jgi:hypothetical protein
MIESAEVASISFIVLMNASCSQHYTLHIVSIYILLNGMLCSGERYLSSTTLLANSSHYLIEGMCFLTERTNTLVGLTLFDSAKSFYTCMSSPQTK